jgi:hypothetical protein
MVIKHFCNAKITAQLVCRLTFSMALVERTRETLFSKI